MKFKMSEIIKLGSIIVIGICCAVALGLIFLQVYGSTVQSVLSIGIVLVATLSGVMILKSSKSVKHNKIKS